MHYKTLSKERLDIQQSEAKAAPLILEVCQPIQYWLIFIFCSLQFQSVFIYFFSLKMFHEMGKVEI